MKTRILVLVAIAGLIPLAASSLSGQAGKAAAPAHKIIHPSELKWTPIIQGSDMAVVAGDPDKEGEPFVIRIRQAAGANVPPHWHPQDEYLTVLKGTFLVGMGETFDKSKLQPMNAGNFILIPKEMRHFATARGETIVQVHGMGPFKVNWVNPADVIPPDVKK